jgi:hypothetical protein
MPSGKSLMQIERIQEKGIQAGPILLTIEARRRENDRKLLCTCCLDCCRFPIGRSMNFQQITELPATIFSAQVEETQENDGEAALLNKIRRFL